MAKSNSTGTIRRIPQVIPGRPVDPMVADHQADRNVRIMRELQQQKVAAAANTLATLTDVSVPAPTNGQVLTYVTADGKWEPGAGSSAPAEHATLVAPIDANYAWINQGSATVTATLSGIYLRALAAGAGADLKIRKKAAPATPYTITAYFKPLLLMKQFHSCGLLFRESSSGKLALFDMVMTNTQALLRSTKFTNPTTFSADYQTVPMPTLYNWFRIADTGANRICSLSTDGINWAEVNTVGHNDFLVADEVGFYAGAENDAGPNIDTGMLLLSWAEA